MTSQVCAARWSTSARPESDPNADGAKTPGDRRPETGTGADVGNRGVSGAAGGPTAVRRDEPTPGTSGSARRPDRGGLGWWIAAVVASTAITAAVFRSAPGLGFLGDDLWQLEALARRPALSMTPIDRFFRPASWTLLRFEHAAFGSDAAGYHVVSMGLQALNSALVVAMTSAVGTAIARRRGRTMNGRRPHAVALVAGLVFAVHPSHGEAVNWISAQPDLLMTAGALVAVATFAIGLDGHRAWRWASPIAFAFSLVCKESAVVMPLALVALIWCAGAARGSQEGERSVQGVPSRERRASASMLLAAIGTIRPVAPHLVVLVAYLAARRLALHEVAGGYGLAAYAVSPLAWVRQALGSGARSVLPSGPAWVWTIVAGAALAAAVASARWWQRRSAPPSTARMLAVFSVSSTLVTLLPVAAFGASPFSASGERYVYLPSAFASILVGLGVVALARRSRAVAWGVLAMTIAACAAISVREAGRWNDASRSMAAMVDGLGTAMSSRDGSGPLLVVEAPDSVRGAVSFRNAASGLDVVDPALKSDQLLVVTARAIPDNDLDVDVDLSRDCTRIVVRPGAGAEIGQDLGARSEVDPGPWSIRSTGQGGYVIDFERPVDPSQVVWYSNGGLHRLEQ